ncbi:MAG: RNA polymerase sigma factor [Opitutaceae bacterium]|jgi:RNA polymerase sigma-70 factor (ECF subfamily)
METSPQSEVLSDHELMLAVRDGDISLLGELFERHHRALYGFFVNLTGQRTVSEDLVQQVFYRILKYRHTYRDKGKFTTWMYHLGRRVAFDHYHKSNKFPSSMEEADGLNELPDQNPHAAEHASLQDDLALMRKALAEMPLESRELLSLHRFQHLSHEELASIYDCSVGAVKVRVHRALQCLRDTFFRLQARGDTAGLPSSHP